MPTTKEMLEWFDGLILRSMFNLAKMKKEDKKMLKAIRALILASGKGPEVDEDWVKEFIAKFYGIPVPSIMITKMAIAMLREIGVRVKKKS
jgi:hypothetical protein